VRVKKKWMATDQALTPNATRVTQSEQSCGGACSNKGGNLWWPVWETGEKIARQKVCGKVGKVRLTNAKKDWGEAAI